MPDATTRLRYLVAIIPGKIAAISDADLSAKPSGKWSKKEILGHLIDSAANNHQRLICAQYEDIPAIFYNQDQWVALNHYNELETSHLLNFWTAYNQQLIAIIQRVPPENLDREYNTGGSRNFTLQWLIDDYVAHMEHHLKVIVDY